MQPDRSHPGDVARTFEPVIPTPGACRRFINWQCLPYDVTFLFVYCPTIIFTRVVLGSKNFTSPNLFVNVKFQTQLIYWVTVTSTTFVWAWLTEFRRHAYINRRDTIVNTVVIINAFVYNIFCREDHHDRLSFHEQVLLVFLVPCYYIAGGYVRPTLFLMRILGRNLLWPGLDYYFSLGPLRFICLFTSAIVAPTLLCLKSDLRMQLNFRDSWQTCCVRRYEDGLSLDPKDVERALIENAVYWRHYSLWEVFAHFVMQPLLRILSPVT